MDEKEFIEKIKKMGTAELIEFEKKCSHEERFLIEQHKKETVRKMAERFKADLKKRETKEGQLENSEKYYHQMVVINCHLVEVIAEYIDMVGDSLLLESHDYLIKVMGFCRENSDNAIEKYKAVQVEKSEWMI